VPAAPLAVDPAAPLAVDPAAPLAVDPAAPLAVDPAAPAVVVPPAGRPAPASRPARRTPDPRRTPAITTVTISISLERVICLTSFGWSPLGPRASRAIDRTAHLHNHPQTDRDPIWI
jgi:hypothetical protein